MHSAQAQLADAYLTVGAGTEARVIAEDLVAREPWDRSNIERFRRALTLLGEPDIDAIIAERLSGESPFTSTDFMWPADPGGAEMTPMPVSPAPPVAMEATAAADEITPIESAPPLSPSQRPESHEVDLSDVLQDWQQPEVPANEPAPAIENVLEGLRQDAAHDASPETAEQHFKMAATYVDMGMHEEAMKALEVAARSPRHRFRAGAMLAKAYLDANDAVHAIEWYERAVEAPAPSLMAHHALLYELASVLQAHGEGARALAVLLELQAEAGEYRDVSSRLEQLKVQMGS
jgi:tetratricopeptide (TPR) repeat protein